LFCIDTELPSQTVPYTETESRQHVLRTRDVISNTSVALQTMQHYRGPPYDPSALSIDAGISVYSAIRGPKKSDSAAAPDANGVVDDDDFVMVPSAASRKSNKRASGKAKSRTRSATKTLPSKQQASTPSDEHAFVRWAPGSSDPLQALINPRNARAAEPPVPPCLKNFSLSPWNPAPHHLRLRGQLLYLCATTLEGDFLHITSTPKGFYVDRSDNNHFDPSPRQPKTPGGPIYYSNLFSLFSAFSRLFVSHLAESLSLADPLDFDPLSSMNLTNCLPANPWLTFTPTPTADNIRSQAAYLLTGSTTPDSLPAARDWNEELVQIRELPRSTADERLLRDRVLARFYSDFAAAAARIVPAIVRGELPPVNPNEPREQATCIHNNTLFTPAEDALGQYAHLGGHEAARVCVVKDVAGIRSLNSLDIDKLNLMATAVVDYQGERWLAQSLVPGIFNRPAEETETAKQDETTAEGEKKAEGETKTEAETKDASTNPFRIVYGSVDTEHPDQAHVADPSFHELAKKVATAAHLALHTVTDVSGRETQLYTSVDSHGVVGSDGRSYLIDVCEYFA
jgi:protein TIF31